MLKISPAQCRAARALLNVNQPKLATMAALSLSTIVDFERERRPVTEQTVEAISVALEVAGIIFVDEDLEGPGVRLRKQHGRSGQHAETAGRATEAIEKMDRDIAADTSKKRPRK